VEELWRDIPGFGDRYEINALGEVRSKPYLRTDPYRVKRVHAGNVLRIKNGTVELKSGHHYKTVEIAEIYSLVFPEFPPLEINALN
jgi:hypothetical protein